MTLDEHRLDIYLNKNYNFSRNYSKEIIQEGFVKVNEKIILKPSFKVKAGDYIFLDKNVGVKYVSRGGLKLEKALQKFNINLKDLVCLDIGSSTGGFTDCMLRFGAKKVYALDVGTNQLDKSLLENKKVISIENTDIRKIDKSFFKEKIDFISTDVSFISIMKIVSNIFEILDDNGLAVVLVKPQFEVGRQNLNKRGIVKNIKIHKKILNDIINFIIDVGFNILGFTYSPIKGGSGNIEYLVYIKKEEPESFNLCEKIINEAFETL